MAEVSVGSLGSLTNADLADGDEIVIRDVSVTSGGQAKRIAVSELVVFLRGQNLGGGGQPAQTHSLYWARGATSTQRTFAADDFTASGRSATVTSGTDITIASYSGLFYNAIAIPDTRTLRQIYYSSRDQTGGFTQTANVTIAGTVYKVYRSNHALAQRGITSWQVTTDAA